MPLTYQNYDKKDVNKIKPKTDGLSVTEILEMSQAIGNDWLRREGEERLKIISEMTKESTKATKTKKVK